MKKNNKGFAITTVIFGTMILFMLLLLSILGLTSNYLKNLNLLTDSVNGTRNTGTMKAICVTQADITALKRLYFKETSTNHSACMNNVKSGLYCFGSPSTSSCSTNCQYVPRKRVCN